MFTVASKLVYLFRVSLFSESLLADSLKQNSLYKNGITLYYLFYGTAQIILSAVFDKINVKKYLFITTLVSSLLTFSLYFSFGEIYSCFALCLMGIFQAGVWCCSISLLNENLRFSRLFFANSVLTCAFPLGGACACVTVFMCGLFNRVKFSFIVSSFLILFACVFLFCVLRSFNKSTETSLKETALKSSYNANPFGNENVILTETLKKRYNAVLYNGKLKTLYILLTGLCATLSYSVYSCVTDYAPAVLKSSFSVNNNYALAFSVFVPLSAVVGGITTIYLCKAKPDCNFIAMLFSFLSAVIMLCLTLFGGTDLTLTVFLSVMFAMFSKGVCSVFETVVVTQTKNIFSSGGFSAYTNACSSLGALLSSLIMCLTLKIGTVISYGCVLIAALLLCFLTFSLFIMFYKNKNLSR